jgi:hemin uptake protein HemP
MSFDTENRDRTPADAAASSVAAAPFTPRRLFSEQLIGPGREVLIRHAGCDYRLRITRQGKLILTK